MSAEPTTAELFERRPHATECVTEATRQRAQVFRMLVDAEASVEAARRIERAAIEALANRLEQEAI